MELNDSEVGDTVKSAGAVPVRRTDCGLDESPSMIVRVADSELVEAVKITLSVQDIPAGMEMPHEVLVTAKSVSAAAGTPAVMVALVKEMATAVLFVSVTICGAVAVPCAVAVKVSEVGEMTRVGSRVNEAAKPSVVLPALRAASNAPVVTGKFDEEVTPAMKTVGGAVVVPSARPKTSSGETELPAPLPPK